MLVITMAAMSFPVMASDSEGDEFAESAMSASAGAMIEEELTLENWMMKPFSKGIETEAAALEQASEISKAFVEQELVLENWMTVPFETEGFQESPALYEAPAEDPMCMPAP